MNATIAAIVLALGLGVFSTPDAAKAISGGSPSTIPWLVKVLGVRAGEVDTRCVGAALNEQIVITAAHCEANAVVFAHRTATLRSTHTIAGSDIALLVLTAAQPLAHYATLGGDRVNNTPFPAGTLGSAYGAAAHNPRLQTQLRLRLMSHEWSGVRELFYMNSGTGRLDAGDSGGPLVVDGLLVAIAHGTATDPLDGQPVFIYHGVTPALEPFAQLEYQRKARLVLASEL